MSFQENLRYYREKAGYSSKDFADLLKIPYATYSGYEYKNREPKYEMLCKIADLLQMSTDDLLGRTTNIIGKKEDDKLEKELDKILNPTRKRKNISVKVKSIDKNYVNFSFVVNNYCVPISIEKKSIMDNINFVNEITNTARQKIFQKNINNTIVEVIKANLIGAPVTVSNMGLLYLQNALSSTSFIQDYEENKKSFPKINMLIHEPKLIENK